MDNKNDIIELVVYRLSNNPNNNKQILIEQTNRGLAKLEGYKYRKVYQSSEDPNLLFDFVAWDNVENAINAVKNMKKIPELINFINLIEKTEVFEHFSFYDNHLINNKETETVELVIYELKIDDNHKINEFFDTYSTEIKKSKGYCNRVLLQSTKNKNLWAERVFWDNIELARENEIAMQNNPILGTAFSIVEKVIIMNHFIGFE